VMCFGLLNVHACDILLVHCHNTECSKKVAPGDFADFSEMAWNINTKYYIFIPHFQLPLRTQYNLTNLNMQTCHFDRYRHDHIRRIRQSSMLN